MFSDDLPQVELYFVDDDEVMQGISEMLFKDNLFARSVRYTWFSLGREKSGVFKIREQSGNF